MTKQAFDKIAAGLREAGDVAAIIAERDAAIRERDEAREENKQIRAAMEFALSAPARHAETGIRIVGASRTFDQVVAERDEARVALASARAEALEEAATAATRAAWKHEGDDDYSRGMDRGAREQVEACAAAIRALKEGT